jgi:ferredoxin
MGNSSGEPDFVELRTMRAGVLLLLVHTVVVSAFALPSAGVRATAERSTAVRMGMFDGLKGAFANDDTLGKRENAGLSKEKTKRTVTWVGPKGEKKVAQALAGQKLRDVARSCNIPIKYDCNEGTCKTCEAQVGSGRAKICVTKMPDKDVTIKYNIR